MKTTILLALIAAAAALGYALAQSESVEVRVVARSAADGRIEFGILHDDERLLPTGRYMSARQISARDDRWLRSTPVEIELDAAPQQLATPPNVVRVEGTGEDVRALQLGVGVWYCATSVEGNGALYPHRFRFEGREGGYENILGTGNGSARTAIRVGVGLREFAGTIDVEISAQPNARWTIECELQ